MAKIVVDHEEFIFEPVDIIPLLKKATAEYLGKYQDMPWGFNLGIIEYASLYLHHQDFYEGNFQYPIAYCGMKCFCNPDYNGHVIPVLDFKTALMKNSSEEKDV